MSIEEKPEEVLVVAIQKNGKIEDYEGVLGQLENVDLQNNKGHTILYVAVDTGRQNWVETLLQRGADPFTKCPTGVSVEELARVMYSKHPHARNRKAIFQMIQQREPRSSPRVQHPGRAQNDPGPKNRNLDLSVSEEILCLRTLMVEGLQSIQEEISELKRETSQREAMLKNLDSGMAGMSLHDQGRLERDADRGLPWSPPNSQKAREQKIRQECIEHLMRQTEVTEVCKRDAVKLSLVRQHYEKIYDAGKYTRTILNFLRDRRGFKILVDPDSENIEQLRHKFRDHDGENKFGCTVRSFADLRRLQVYFGATPEFYPLQGSLKEEWRITNHLAVPLAQLCIHMAFQNEGRPYDEDAGHLEELFGRVLKEAEERITKVKKSQLHEWVPRDFERRTRLGKEIELICLPLAISAHFDSDTMVNVLLRELPSLLVFYDHFVQPKLEGNLQSGTK